MYVYAYSLYFRCLTFQPRLTRVLWKSLPLLNSLGRGKRLDLLKLLCLPSLGLGPSHMGLWSSLFMIMALCLVLRSLILLRMTSLRNLLLVSPWLLLFRWLSRTQHLQLHHICLWMPTRMFFPLLLRQIILSPRQTRSRSIWR